MSEFGEQVARDNVVLAANGVIGARLYHEARPEDPHGSDSQDLAEDILGDALFAWMHEALQRHYGVRWEDPDGVTQTRYVGAKDHAVNHVSGSARPRGTGHRLVSRWYSEWVDG